MGQFIYMLPKEGIKGPVPAAYGLADRLADGTPCGSVISVVDGLPAMPGQGSEEHDCLCMGRGERIGFYPDDQVWRRVERVGGGAWWLGWRKNEGPPTEGDLRREDSRGGYGITMGDATVWYVPPARRYPEGTFLPSVLRLAPDGESEVREVQPRWKDLWTEIGAFAEPYYAALNRQGPETGAEEQEEADSVGELADLPLKTCIRLLSVNYRVGPPEVNALGLITDDARSKIGLAAIDWWGFLAIIARTTSKKGERSADPTPE